MSDNPKQYRRRISTEEKAKVVAAVLGDILECRTIAGLFEGKLFEEHSFWDGGGLATLV